MPGFGTDYRILHREIRNVCSLGEVEYIQEWFAELQRMSITDKEKKTTNRNEYMIFNRMQKSKERTLMLEKENIFQRLKESIKYFFQDEG